MRVLWTVRRSNQTSLKEINPEYSLDGLMLKLKLQYFSQPNAKSQLIRKVLDAGRQEEKGSADNEMFESHHWLSGHGFEQAP